MTELVVDRVRVSFLREDRSRAILFALLLLGLCLRIGFMARHHGIVHADETFQYMEQAHRVVFGEGAVPWEYVVKARSWILPGVLLPLVFLQNVLGFSPSTLYGLVGLQMSIISLLPIYAGYRLGAIAGGQQAALFAALLNAIWFDSILLSPHMLPDTLAAALLPYALLRAVEARSTRKLVLAGIAWGLVLAVRIQLGPTVGLGLLLTAWPRPRALFLQGIGLALAAAAYGFVDWLTLGGPFVSVINYVDWNIIIGVSSRFDLWPWYSYGLSFIANWSVALPLVAIVGIAGLRQAALPWALAVSLIVLMSAIAHKEDRFVYPAIPLILTACGIGSDRLLHRGQLGNRGPWLLAALWATLSVGLTFTPRFAIRADRGTSSLSAMLAASRLPDLCGFGLLEERLYSATPARSALPPHTKIFAVGSGVPPTAYNAVLSFQAESLPGYATVGCWSEPRKEEVLRACLFTRPGRCEAQDFKEIDLAPPPFDVESLKRRAR